MLAVYPDYFALFGGESALDWQERMYYTIMQYGNATKLSFELVALDLRSVEVNSHPYICGMDCPYALLYYNSDY